MIPTFQDNKNKEKDDQKNNDENNNENKDRNKYEEGDKEKCKNNDDTSIIINHLENDDNKDNRNYDENKENIPAPKRIGCAIKIDQAALVLLLKNATWQYRPPSAPMMGFSK